MFLKCKVFACRGDVWHSCVKSSAGTALDPSRTRLGGSKLVINAVCNMLLPCVLIAELLMIIYIGVLRTSLPCANPKSRQNVSYVLWCSPIPTGNPLSMREHISIVNSLPCVYKKASGKQRWLHSGSRIIELNALCSPARDETPTRNHIDQLQV